jgi:uncharacterized membrane protein (UPF0136 family)
MNFAQIVLLAYSVLMLVGGVIGYTASKSMPSLIAGIASSFILDVAFILTKQGGRNGYLLGGITAFALTAFFIYRVMNTGKFMPAGGLAILSVIAGLLILSGLNRASVPR